MHHLTDGAGLALCGLAEGEVDQLRDVLRRIDVLHPLARGLREGCLVRLLKSARAAEPPSTSSGIALSVATYIGVTVLVMAGPLAHTMTPGLRTAAAPHE